MAKYLKKFETHSQYEAYINSQDAILPNVSYCVDNNDVHYNPYVHDYSKQYLKTTALTDGTINLLFLCDEEGMGRMFVYASKAAYSLDDGQTWTVNEWTNPDADFLISIPVNAGDEILWKSDISYITYNETYGWGYGYFGGTASFNVDGNIMSLSHYDDFVNATTVSNSNFAGLFHDANVVNAENLVLPITSLSEDCYKYMFNGCKKLTTAPELPATTLANRCYYEMFRGCINLTTAPELPATTLVYGCYIHMFYACYKLKYIKAMFTTTPGTTYTTEWVKDVASTGTFVKNSAATWNVTGVNGVPTGWTVETASA